MVVISSTPLTGLSLAISIPSSHPFYRIKPFLRTFVPTDIDGCALWLDANDATTLTLSGSNVTQWRDKSGNAYHAVGYNNTATYDATGLNSKPALAFSSTKSMVSPVPAGTFPTAVSTFVVYQFSGAVSSSAVYTIINRTLSQASTFAAPFSAYQNNGNVVRYIGKGTTNGNQRYEFTAGTIYTNTTPTLYYFNVASNANTTWNESVNGTTTSYTLTLGTAAYGDTASNVCIGGSLDTAVFMNGFISEVIMYNTTLTTAQRQQVEGYLAKKWNLSTVVPPFTNPTSIPGCTLWLDAQDSSTITGTSTVTQWRDKSGLACNTTAYYGSPALTAAAINGYQAISFNGSSYLFGSNSNSTTTATFFFVGTMSSSVATYATMFSFSPSNTNSWGATSSFNGGSPQSSGTRVITPQRNASGASSPKFTPGFNTPFIFTTVFDGTNWVGYGNGITLGSMASTGNFAYTKYVVGSEESSGGTLTTGWTGYIGELIAYNTALTATQRQQVEYYLSTKWGLTTASSFSPSMIPGLRLWLDAQDASTVTTSGGLVTNVADKSSNGWVLSGANGFSYPNNTFNGSYPSFYGSNPYNSWTLGSNASLTFTQPFTVFFVAQRLNLATSTNFYDGYVFDGLNSTNRCYMYGNWYVAGALTNSSMNVNIGTTTPVVVTTIFNTSNSSQYLNGTTFSSNVNGGTSNLSSGIRIANGWNNGNSWVGHFCELVIYNKVVSTTERQQVEYYLGTKWGLLTSNTFTPSVIPICPIWFDAADTTNIIRSGSQVTAWSNKGASQSVASNKT